MKDHKDRSLLLIYEMSVKASVVVKSRHHLRNVLQTLYNFWKPDKVIEKHTCYGLFFSPRNFFLNALVNAFLLYFA